MLSGSGDEMSRKGHQRGRTAVGQDECMSEVDGCCVWVRDSDVVVMEVKF